MRRTLPFLPFALALLVSACSKSTEPPVYSIAGTWESTLFSGADIEMTLVETARAVVGAGHWVSPDGTSAFRVSGANVRANASLLLDFDGQEDVNFQGEFEERNDTTYIAGALHGGGYEGESITFRRIDEQ